MCFLRAVNSFHIVFSWISESRISLKFRIAFIISYVPVLVTKKVYFLGNWFSSDNAVGLLMLPEYVPLAIDVHDKIGKPVSPRILDIGANVGQFSFTWLSLFGGNCLSVEPNSTIYTYLMSNMLPFRTQQDAWKLICSGCGPVAEMQELYFVHKKSAQGSLNSNFAKTGLFQPNKLTSIISLFQPLTPKLLGSIGYSNDSFDLVKIDVEGNEIGVIQGLRDLNFSYVLIEIDNRRGLGSSFTDIVNQLGETTNRAVTHVYSDFPELNRSFQNALFRIG